MRAKVGKMIRLFNEKDGEFICEISEVSKKDVILTIIESTRQSDSETIRNINLYIAPIRNTRMTTLIEKAVELGVKSITPVITEHTVHRDLNNERINTIITEATEQSERLSRATLNDPITFDELLNRKEELYYADERPEHGTKILDLKNVTAANILVGPEGGFSENEFEQLKSSDATGITLGDTILRSETATIKAICLFSEIIN